MAQESENFSIPELIDAPDYLIAGQNFYEQPPFAGALEAASAQTGVEIDSLRRFLTNICREYKQREKYLLPEETPKSQQLSEQMQAQSWGIRNRIQYSKWIRGDRNPYRHAVMALGRSLRPYPLWYEYVSDMPHTVYKPDGVYTPETKVKKPVISYKGSVITRLKPQKVTLEDLLKEEINEANIPTERLEYIELSGPDELTEGQNFYNQTPFSEILTQISEKTGISINQLQDLVYDASMGYTVLPPYQTAVNRMKVELRGYPYWQAYVNTQKSRATYKKNGTYEQEAGKYVPTPSYIKWVTDRIKAEKSAKMWGLEEVSPQGLEKGEEIRGVQWADTRRNRRWRILKQAELVREKR